MKKRIHILLFVLIAMFVLIGWGRKEVKLLDGNKKKLIDLKKAIELAKPGGSAGDLKEESEAASESNTVEDDEAPESESNAVHDSIDDVAKDIVIIIRDENISYSCGNDNRDSIPDTQLESRIRLDFASGAQVTLLDNFAEAHVYRNVRGILEKLKNDIGLTYREDQFVGGE